MQCCSDVSIADFEQVVVARAVILTVCGYRLLQNVEKRRKSNKFNRSQIELSPFPEFRPIKFVLFPYIRPGRINGNLRYLRLV